MTEYPTWKEFFIFTLVWLALFLGWMFFFPLPNYASDFTNYINQPIKSIDERKELRIEWNNFFRFDMFKGYFAVKDLEDTFREYTAINLGQFKGRLKIGENYKSIEYKFKIEF